MMKLWNVLNVTNDDYLTIELVSRDYDMIAEVRVDKINPAHLGTFTTGTNYYVIPYDEKTYYQFYIEYSELCPSHLKTAETVPLEQWRTKYGRGFDLPSPVYECLVGIMCTVLA